MKIKNKKINKLILIRIDPSNLKNQIKYLKLEIKILQINNQKKYHNMNLLNNLKKLFKNNIRNKFKMLYKD